MPNTTQTELFSMPDKYKNHVAGSYIEALHRYFNQRIRPGHFLRSVLENNLCDAVNYMHPLSGVQLVQIVQALDEAAPLEAWGSREKVAAWLKIETPCDGAESGTENNAECPRVAELVNVLREPMINEAAVPGADFAEQLAQLGATMRQYSWKNTAAALEAKAAQIRAALDACEVQA